MCREWPRVCPRSGNDQAVGGIAVKTGRQLVERHDDAHIHGRERQYARIHGTSQPFPELQRQHKTPLRVEHLGLPHADGR